MAKTKPAQRPRGRPPSPFDEKHQVRLTAEQKREWTELAIEAGLNGNLSTWLRQAGEEKAKRQRAGR